METKKLKEFKKYSKTLYDFGEFMYNKVVWEVQEGQPEHFDKLNKAERIALASIYSKVVDLNAELNRYFHYFNDEEEQE